MIGLLAVAGPSPHRRPTLVGLVSVSAFCAIVGRLVDSAGAAVAFTAVTAVAVTVQTAAAVAVR